MRSKLAGIPAKREVRIGVDTIPRRSPALGVALERVIRAPGAPAPGRHEPAGRDAMNIPTDQAGRSKSGEEVFRIEHSGIGRMEVRLPVRAMG